MNRFILFFVFLSMFLNAQEIEKNAFKSKNNVNGPAFSYVDDLGLWVKGIYYTDGLVTIKVKILNKSKEEFQPDIFLLNFLDLAEKKERTVLASIKNTSTWPLKITVKKHSNTIITVSFPKKKDKKKEKIELYIKGKLGDENKATAIILKDFMFKNAGDLSKFIKK